MASKQGFLLPLLNASNTFFKQVKVAAPMEMPTGCQRVEGGNALRPESSVLVTHPGIERSKGRSQAPSNASAHIFPKAKKKKFFFKLVFAFFLNQGLYVFK